MPANGALNPAEMAAATPPPRMTLVVILSFKVALINAPSVAPKWTNGPY